jgi:quinolinate synthase
VLITECSMADNICGAFPETEFLRPCNLCPHMQQITLASIHETLLHMRPAIDLPADVAEGARRCVRRMFEAAERRAA